MQSLGSNLIPALLVFSGLVTAATCGYWAGLKIGKGYRMTRKEAATVMAKASWRNR